MILSLLLDYFFSQFNHFNCIIKCTIDCVSIYPSTFQLRYFHLSHNCNLLFFMLTAFLTSSVHARHLQGSRPRPVSMANDPTSSTSTPNPTNKLLHQQIVNKKWKFSWERVCLIGWQLKMNKYSKLFFQSEVDGGLGTLWVVLVSVWDETGVCWERY